MLSHDMNLLVAKDKSPPATTSYTLDVALGPVHFENCFNFFFKKVKFAEVVSLQDNYGCGHKFLCCEIISRKFFDVSSRITLEKVLEVRALLATTWAQESRSSKVC